MAVFSVGDDGGGGGGMQEIRRSGGEERNKMASESSPLLTAINVTSVGITSTCHPSHPSFASIIIMKTVMFLDDKYVLLCVGQCARLYVFFVCVFAYVFSIVCMCVCVLFRECP